MNNREKIILDLCGGTGAWSMPYKNAGYDVRLITLPDFDVLTFEPPENVYGILAAPPCDQFSRARNGHKTPPDYESAMKIVVACLGIVWKCRLNHKLKFWALENPTGKLRQFLGKPAFSFQPYEFGDLYTKQTDLWGYFKFPKKLKHCDLLKFISEKDFIRNIGGTDEKKKILRSITPAHFARAFYLANK